ncbi:MAG: isoprenylcysteine carboxylmethyltransferase family protein [Nitrospirae bacterium]|nr:isoprenylcysteine carboxylmethyltransferase family protein [Nitrospirota bacterium]
MSPTNDGLYFRETIVFLSALIYWGGVRINVYRVSRHIGKSPNLMKYKSLKEKLLFLGWFIVIAGWAGQPLIIGSYGHTAFISFINVLYIPFGLTIGLALALTGYACTLWCYKTLGDSWRLGVDGKAKTVLVNQGIYRRVRHPIYLFQIIILIGMTWLLPTPFSIAILLIHFVCISIMTRDEEAYLMKTHGAEYREYFSSTGRFLPKLMKK